MMGRVSSTFMSLISISQGLGLLFSGFLAERLGVRQLFMACGAVAVLISMAGYLKFREKHPVSAPLTHSITTSETL
jgi:MFS family permease